MRSARALLAAALALTACDVAALDTFVDQASGSDLNDGLSWATAKQSIQAAVDAALAAPEVPTVRVAEGTYREAVWWTNRGISLIGGYAPGGTDWDPDAHVTAIDGEGVRNLLLWGGWLFEPCVITGFTVRGAMTTAIGVGGSDVTLSRCIIERNGWVRRPRGMAIAAVDLRAYNLGSGGSLLVEDCRFTDNAYLLTGYDPGQSAALHVAEARVATIRRCVFERNWHERDGYADFDKVDGINFVFEDVRMDAAYAYFSLITMRNVLVRRHLTTNGGSVGAIPTLTNVTVGQIRVMYEEREPLRVNDSIVTGMVDGVPVAPITGWTGATAVRVDQSLVRGGWPGGTNIINADPLFVEGPLGDHYLAQTGAGDAVTSPAVDAGSRDVLAAGLDSATTRVDGVTDSGVVDLGYHYPPVTGPHVIRRSTSPSTLAPHATTTRLPWTDAPGTTSDPALPLLFYDVPSAPNELFVILDRATDAPRLSWAP